MVASSDNPKSNNTKAVYPAVFTPELTGYSVEFRDVECCFTQGETFEDALVNAQDVLAMMLANMAVEGKQPSEPNFNVLTEDNEFVVLVKVDYEGYLKQFSEESAACD